MSKKNTKDTHQNKITPIDISLEDLENPDMDQFLRESVMKEADELEARLNSDPALVGVGASDDMFDAIVAKLKAHGVWEEDEAVQSVDNSAQNEMPSGKVSAKASEKNILEDTFAEKTGSAMNTEKNTSAVQGALSVEIDGVTGKASDKVHNKISNKDSDQVSDTVLDTTEFSEETAALDLDKMADEKAKESDKELTEQELEKLYKLLPEKDRRAMELGRQTEQREEKRKIQRRRWRRIGKRVGMVAAVFVVVFGLGMSTEASRGWILKMWDAAMEGFGFKAKTNLTKDEIIVKGKEEQDALETIGGTLNIPVLFFDYVPQGMEFLSYEIVDEKWYAMMFYEYQEKIFSVEMIKMDQTGTSYYTLDNEAVLRDTITTNQNVEAKIWETNLNVQNETYVVEMEYENCRYILNGMLSFDEIKKMVEFILFF